MDIIVSILEFVDNRGTTLKTHILYSANLNSKSLDKFLNKLISAGLITTAAEEDKDYYFITARGRIFLRYISRALRMLKDERASKINNEIRRKLSNENSTITVREGLVYRGASGVPYVLPIAFIIQDKKGKRIIAVAEIITPEMTIKEAINTIAWTWIISKDMNIPSIVVIAENHVDTLTKVMEPLDRKNGRAPTVIRYGRYEYPETIANKLVEKIVSSLNHK